MMHSLIDTNENELVRLSKSGCHKAIAVLFQIHSKTIALFIRKNLFDRTLDHGVVDDLLQDTFIQVINKINNFDQRSAFSTWAHGIALNLIRNYCNRSPSKKYRIEGEESLSKWLNKQSTESPEDQVIAEESLFQVCKAYNSLPAALKEATRLIIVEGLSYQDAAVKLDVSINIVKNRLFRAREIFRYARKRGELYTLPPSINLASRTRRAILPSINPVTFYSIDHWPTYADVCKPHSRLSATLVGSK